MSATPRQYVPPLPPHERGVMLALEQLAHQPQHWTGGIGHPGVDADALPLVVTLADVERLLRRAVELAEGGPGRGVRGAG